MLQQAGLTLGGGETSKASPFLQCERPNRDPEATDWLPLEV